MLQQTRVDTVIPYFERFMDRFPTVHALAEADPDTVMSLWSGLGYYSRARNLQRAAAIIVQQGYFPDDLEGLRALPGIGEYIAGAVASIAFGLDVATVDGNIARVMARVHADASSRRQMWAHTETHLPKGRAGDYNQALMDLGARICVPRSPRCEQCPISAECTAAGTDTVHLYPPAKIKKKVPEAHLACVVELRNGTYLLGRRPEEGLWGGLWEFPTTTWTGGDDASAVAAWWGAKLEYVGTIRHVLTHRVFHLAVFVPVGDSADRTLKYKRVARFTCEQLEEVGTSRLTAKALEIVQASS